MIGALRAALVIARRDYVASVWSRSFIFFLIGPLMPVIATLMFSTAGATVDRRVSHPTVAVLADGGDAILLKAARTPLAARLGDAALPDLEIVAPAPDRAAQTRALLADAARNRVAVLDDPFGSPSLTGPRAPIASIRGEIGLILDQARAMARLHAAGSTPPKASDIALRFVDQAAGSDMSGRLTTARIGQLVLMMLTMILSGMLLSNLIEEKSNKVIEVLAAAVPVDAIFVGKLIAMLAMSLTGIFVWGSLAALLLAQLPLAGEFPAPAIGWSAFAALGLVYFTALYLLWGALFLGIGGRAGSVREVQTLSLPATMLQVGVAAFSSTAVAALDGPLGIAAAIFPWSSPFAMLARAAQSDAVWPHLAAILWQALWIAIIIRFSAASFRKSVLKSGPAPRKQRLGTRATA